MNKQLIGLILALTLPLTAIAEMDTTADSSKRIEHLTKELGLSNEQKVKVEAIFDAQKAKMKAIHDETHTSLQAVFTPEQMTKFDAMQEKRKQARKEKRANTK
jgi:Spy/CpxP family protein refolding chaperone